MSRCKSLLTGENNVYVQIYPWDAQPTDEFIYLLKSNGLAHYCSKVMNVTDFYNNLNKGFTLIECESVLFVKETLRKYANSLIN